jgi:hypothetical protein
MTRNAHYGLLPSVRALLDFLIEEIHTIVG